MRHRWLKTLSGTVVAASLLALPAAAAEFGEWNTDGDAGLTRNEFDTRFGGLGVYNKWDADRNGIISQSEWQAGIGNRGADLNTRFGVAPDGDLYTQWNTDGADGLTEQEFNTGIYGGYDRNRNNVIEEPEFGDLGDDIGDGGFWDV